MAAASPRSRAEPREPEGSLTVTIDRITVDFRDYKKVLAIRRVRKFALAPDETNTVAIHVATRSVDAADTKEHDELQPGANRLWEATRPGETLSMDLHARSPSGSPVLVVWSWK